MELILAAMVTILTTVGGFVMARLGTLERRIDALDRENDLLWVWNRQAQDAYYRHVKPGSPAFPSPPKGIRGIDSGE